MTISGIHVNKAVTGGFENHFQRAYKFAAGITSSSDLRSLGGGGRNSSAADRDFDFFVLDRLPTWVQLENPEFVDFFSLFYEWLNVEMGVGLERYTDIDQTNDDFILL